MSGARPSSCRCWRLSGDGASCHRATHAILALSVAVLASLKNLTDVPIYVCAAVWISLFLVLKLARAGESKLLRDPKVKYTVPLVKKEVITHNTYRFRFGLPKKNMHLGLPIGRHITFSANVDGKICVRSYTPVTSDDDKGFFDVVIKVYFANVHPKFPDGGIMSQHLHGLEVGDTIDVRGPTGHIDYSGRGRFALDATRRTSTAPARPAEIREAKKVGMIAGGTGITPMLQVIRAALRDAKDATEWSLLFANQTENDILLRGELESLKEDGRVSVHYTLDRPPEGWEYSAGFIDEEMLGEHMPAPGPDTQILMCGPPPMINFACLPNLKKLGHQESALIVY